jgi:molybdopterin synthase sulfur carrier subunit
MAKVLLFGRLADIAGWRERQVEASTLAELRTALAEDLGDALDGRGIQAAVDLAIVREDVALTGASEVAFLPPMSGG